MKQYSKILDFSLRNQEHVLANILEYALIISITMIAIIATTSILKDQISIMN
ncbi:MAG: hypothetical protein JSC189_001125 [Candidatus Tokpelaia sp. JSC189]|nr:MAG: hypothetical protein JSC189_001125 [Candidatus Tokpelaia sp. JSC189]